MLKKALYVIGAVVAVIIALKVLNYALYYGIFLAILAAAGYIGYRYLRAKISRS